MESLQSQISQPAPPGSRVVHLAVLFLAIVYALYFSAFTCIWHMQFHTYAYDLGTFDQGIWLASQGIDPFVTVRGLHLLGDHVRLLSFVLAPLYWIWDDVRALLVLQSVAIGAGAIFLFRIAERELPGRPWLSLAIAAGYLVNPTVQNLNMDHAHPDAFATTFILAAVDCLRGGRLLPFWIAAALAMSCKEDVPLVFLMMGVALVLEGKRRRFGFLLAGVAGAWFATCMLVILPHFNEVGFFRTSSRGFLAGLGKHGTELSWLFARLVRRESAVYLGSLGLPFLFVFLLAPLWLLPALPALAANLLSDANYMRSMTYHYHTSIVPFLAIATIDTLARWLPATSARDWRLQLPLAAALLTATVVANNTWSRAPVLRPLAVVSMWEHLQTNPKIAAYRSMLELIPADARVAADYSLLPHLSHRRYIYMLPNPFQQSYWGISGQHTHDPMTIEYIAIHNTKPSKPVAEQVEELAPGQFERVAGDIEYGVFRRKKVAPASARASCGDWNGDGQLDRKDMRSIADAILKGADCPLPVCDADGNGKAAYPDVLRINTHIGDPSAELSCPP